MQGHYSAWQTVCFSEDHWYCQCTVCVCMKILPCVLHIFAGHAHGFVDQQQSDPDYKRFYLIGKSSSFSWMITQRTKPNIWTRNKTLLVSEPGQVPAVCISPKNYSFNTKLSPCMWMLSLTQDIPAVGQRCLYTSAPSPVQRTLQHYTQNHVGLGPRWLFQHFSGPDCLQGDI